jgi:[ribosomal protein S5]-alanine N-acetyltransferase
MPVVDPRRIVTSRMLMRPPTPADLDPYHALFADPAVSRYLPTRGEPLPPERVEAGIARSLDHWELRGYGVWILCDLATGAFLGHCGLRYLDEIHETEILYALAASHWSRGLATEAAGAALRFGFDVAGLARIIALAVPENVASIRVMEKVGMRYERDAFVFGMDLVQYAVSRPSS